MTETIAYIPTRDVANHFGVDPTTVRRWADEGKIASTKTPGGQYRFPASVIEDPALAESEAAAS